jgi:hypothetical protein
MILVTAVTAVTAVTGNVGRPLVAEPAAHGRGSTAAIHREPEEAVEAAFPEWTYLRPGAKRVLGRPARTYAQWAGAHADAFRN